MKNFRCEPRFYFDFDLLLVMAEQILPEFTVEVETLENDVKKLTKIIKPKWDVEKLNITPLLGGLSALVFRVHLENEPSDSFAVRLRKLFSKERGKFPVNDHEFEEKIIQDLWELGFAPKVLAIFQDGYCYEFVEGESITNLHEKDMVELDRLPLEETLEKLAEIHSLKVEDVDYSNITFFNNWKKMLEDVYPSDPNLGLLEKQLLMDELNEMIENGKKLEPFNISLFHGDVHGGNIIWNEETKEITFIDWEYANIGYRAFDVAYFLTYLHMFELFKTTGFNLTSNEYESLYKKHKKMTTMYLAQWNKIREIPLTSEEMEKFEKEVMYFILVRILLMAINLGFLIQDKDYDPTKIPFDIKRSNHSTFKLYKSIKDEMLKQL